MRIDELDDQLNEVVDEVVNYIMNNTRTDFYRCASVLRKHGYVEPEHRMPVYRVLLFSVPEDIRKSFSSMGEAFPVLKQQLRMDMGRGPQGFAETLDKANQFAAGTLWHRDGFVSGHRADLPLEREIFFIYELVAPQSRILWSMKGLKAFAKTLPPQSEARRSLIRSMDPLDGYDDHEIVIDTAHGDCRVIDIHLYENEASD